MIKNKIDFVILWVNDQDINWANKKKYWQKIYGIKNATEERFRNWDNLHYLFRSIDKFAPWVNHVYLVTDDQIPHWLDTNFSKVTVIDHTDIIDDDYLPTFNSQAIELCLHNIPNISDQFVYFNDDMFLIDYVDETDFFEDGKPKMPASLNVIMPIKDNLISQVNFNNISIINDNFNKRMLLKNNFKNWFNYKYGKENFRTLINLIWPFHTGFKQPHSVGVFLKSTFEEVWATYSSVLELTMQSKFRKMNNNNQWLMSDWQLAGNNFVPQKFSFSKDFHLSDNASIDNCARHIINHKSKIICVNDTEILEDFDYAKNIINSCFEKILPKKSRYEK